ncbi:hypothetical protein AQUCO_05300033v1 [Aquilegia coerulea]|uniref:Transmembrane protein n=1 Tax=Aquilegia coerulea TaxID=218851 RepID=A0A2G5CI46_AQUCA|nr:hypothetical protein AQUCO_05300033v1 [Aquilegia coerulea]
MHRSSSITRASEFFLHGSSAGGGGGGVASSSSSSSSSRILDNDELPLYDPLSDFAKKERLRMKFAENAVHVIPLVLVLCAAILWFCSNPDLDMVDRDGSLPGRVEGLTIDADLDVAHSKTGLLSSQDLDGSQENIDKKPGRFSAS